jgi:hypothetical protein
LLGWNAIDLEQFVVIGEPAGGSPSTRRYRRYLSAACRKVFDRPRGKAKRR